MKKFILSALLVLSSAIAWAQTPANDDPIARVPWLVASYVICKSRLGDYLKRQRGVRPRSHCIAAAPASFVSAWQEFHGASAADRGAAS